MLLHLYPSFVTLETFIILYIYNERIEIRTSDLNARTTGNYKVHITFLYRYPGALNANCIGIDSYFISFLLVEILSICLKLKMASRFGTTNDIYLEPCKDNDNTTDMYFSSPEDIEAAMKKAREDQSEIGGSSKKGITSEKNNKKNKVQRRKRTSPPAVNDSSVESNGQTYQNIGDGKKVYFSAQKRDQNEEDDMGIFFTPTDLPVDSPQIRPGAKSRSKNRAKSRYDSGMYSLPDLVNNPTNSPDTRSPESPSKKGGCVTQICWKCKQHTTLIIVMAFCIIIFLASGTGVADDHVAN